MGFPKKHYTPWRQALRHLGQLVGLQLRRDVGGWHALRRWLLLPAGDVGQAVHVHHFRSRAPGGWLLIVLLYAACGRRKEKAEGGRVRD